MEKKKKNPPHPPENLSDSRVGLLSPGSFYSQINFYVCNRVGKDPAVKKGHEKDPST